MDHQAFEKRLQIERDQNKKRKKKKANLKGNKYFKEKKEI